MSQANEAQEAGVADAEESAPGDTAPTLPVDPEQPMEQAGRPSADATQIESSPEEPRGVDDPSEPGAPSGDVTAEDGSTAAGATPPDDDSLRVLANRLGDLTAAFELRAQEYEKTIRGLHSRVEELQRDQLAGLMKPVFVQLADLHAEMLTTSQQARDSGHEDHAGDLSYFAGAFEQILGHFDLESVGAAAGAPFDRRAHAAVMTKKTNDPAADQTVARVVRQGFRLVGEERVLIPARVIVWKAVEAAAPQDFTSAGAAAEQTPEPSPAGDAMPLQRSTETNEGELS